MFFLAFFVLFQIRIVFCEDTAIGIPIPNKRAENTCKATPLIQCTIECDSLMFCETENDPPTVVQKCAESTPYCVPYDTNAKCEATRSDKCKPQSSFVCTGTGYFPDVTDCTKYHLCKDVDQAVASFKCPSGFYYSSKERTCKRSASCFTVKCGATSSMGVYSPDPRFWYACVPNKTPKVNKCPNDNDQFVAGVGCSFICPAEGIFKRDDKSYYFCYRDGSVYKYDVVECPAGTKFDEKTKICELDGISCTAEGFFKINDMSFYFCYRIGDTFSYVIINCKTGTKFDVVAKKCI